MHARVRDWIEKKGKKGALCVCVCVCAHAHAHGSPKFGQVAEG